MMAKRPTPAFEPYRVRDPFARVSGPWLGWWVVVGRTFCGLRVVGRKVYVEGTGIMGVTDAVILDHHAKHYTVDENTSCQSLLEGIKKEALAHGATPLAVQWLGELSPFSEEELKTMAEKLKTKGADKKAPAKADKAAPKSKGNPEALAKAREARASAAQEDRKYKPLVKLADAKVREGTWTARMVEIILGNKTTQAAKDELAADKEYGDRRLDFGWAEKKGLIEFA